MLINPPKKLIFNSGTVTTYISSVHLPFAHLRNESLTFYIEMTTVLDSLSFFER